MEGAVEKRSGYLAGEHSARGDPIPPNCVVIEIHITEIGQLFHSIDPSPLRERDLDPKTAEFIIGWARDARRDAQLALVVHLDRPGLPDEATVLPHAIRWFFSQHALASRRSFRRLMQRGRTSLMIGVVFLALSMFAGGLFERTLAGQRLGFILRESLLIGGWVAMWRPLEIFLYDWWPIRAEARLFDRLSKMPIQVVAADVPSVR